MEDALARAVGARDGMLGKEIHFRGSKPGENRDFRERLSSGISNHLCVIVNPTDAVDPRNLAVTKVIGLASATG